MCQSVYILIHDNRVYILCANLKTQLLSNHARKWEISSTFTGLFMYTIYRQQYMYVSSTPALPWNWQHYFPLYSSIHMKWDALILPKFWYLWLPFCLCEAFPNMTNFEQGHPFLLYIQASSYILHRPGSRYIYMHYSYCIRLQIWTIERACVLNKVPLIMHSWISIRSYIIDFDWLIPQDELVV